MIKVYHTYNNTKHHDVILHDLELYLKDKYNAELIISNNEIELFNSSITVSDCSLLIEDTENDTFKGITFADSPYRFLPFFQNRNNPNDILLISQYNEEETKSINYQCKLKKSIYVASSPTIDLDYFYNKRQEIKEYKDKFYFRGNIGGIGRSAITILETSPYFEGGHNINAVNYFNETINYKIGLCIPGVGEFCYRDIEYMGMGIPMMKFQYINELYHPLIPNYHYISIDRISDFVSERNGKEEHVNAYINRFLEVKDDKEFLNFISTNARKYYEEYLHPNVRLNQIINLLEI